MASISKSNVKPCLWFDGQAEQAAEFYVSIFPNSEIASVDRMGADGDVLGVAFTLDGQEFMGLNGGVRNSSSPKPCHSWWNVKRKRNSTSCGRSCSKAAGKRRNAGG
jgi:predicted 3-demethylubiquinone-9 3-methyltransferase (glyoxalase superfamily)